MKGQNELLLNAATMMQIVEFWLRNRFVSGSHPVPSVTAVRGEANGSTQQFRVTLTHSDSESA